VKNGSLQEERGSHKSSRGRFDSVPATI